MHTLFGIFQGSQRHNLRTCLLLDLCEGLGARETRVSPLSTGRSSFQGDPSERVVWWNLNLYRNGNRRWFLFFVGLPLDGQALYISFGLHIYTPIFLAEIKQLTVLDLKIQVNIFMNKDF